MYHITLFQKHHEDVVVESEVPPAERPAGLPGDELVRVVNGEEPQPQEAATREGTEGDKRLRHRAGEHSALLLLQR